MMGGEPKKYSVKISDRAKFMLLNHFHFLANVSPDAARKTRDAIYNGCASLETMPHRCPKYRTNRTANNYRQLIIGRYQVVFSVDESDDTVYVEYILDSRQSNEI